MPNTTLSYNHKKIGVLFNGGFDSNKGSLYFIKAINSLPIDIKSKLQIFLIGPGNSEHSRRIIKNYGLDSIFFVAGWITGKKYDIIRSRCSIYVLHSKNEGLPAAMLESMAFGLVPIVTPVGGIPEVIIPGQNGFFVDFSDSLSLSKALSKLIEDDELRNQISDSAKKSVVDYDIESYKGKLVRIYGSL